MRVSVMLPRRPSDAALDWLDEALSAVGGSLANLTKLTTNVVDRGYRTDVYRTIARRLADVRPVSTGLVVAGLPLPEMIVQIDAEAAIAATPPQVTRPYDFDSWHGQGFSWRGATVLGTPEEFFVRGQTGTPLDHSTVPRAAGHLPDAAAQAELAMENPSTLLAEAGAEREDICKITVYIGDRADRSAVYPVIGKFRRATRPVSTWASSPLDSLVPKFCSSSISRSCANKAACRIGAFAQTRSERGAIRPSRPAARPRVSAWRSLPATA